MQFTQLLSIKKKFVRLVCTFLLLSNVYVKNNRFLFLIYFSPQQYLHCCICTNQGEPKER